MARSDDDGIGHNVVAHHLFLGQTRPKVANWLGHEMTFHSQTAAIVLSALVTLTACFLASLSESPWAILVALGCSLVFTVALFVLAIWLFRKEPRWHEVFGFWLRTRFAAMLSGSLSLWGASSFSPLVADLPDAKGRRRRTVNLLLRPRR